MKKITLLLFLLLTISFGFGQTTLSAGDVAITGVNSDNPDEFTFVLLTEVLNGTVINFTDGGWTAGGAFRGLNPVNGNISEGVVSWTATSDLPCGTEVRIAETLAGSNVYTASDGTASEIVNGFALQGNGEQLIAFQGTTISPNFIFALHFRNNVGWDTDSTNNQTSAVPAGLTEGVNALARNRQNIVYTYSVTGNTSLILAALVDPGEWIGNNATSQTLGLPSGVSFTCDSTILGAGDVAVTGANSVNPDEFSFVLLTDVVSGTEINFTDGGWTAAGGFRNYTFANTNPSSSIAEGMVTWKATSVLDCGTEIIIAETFAGSNVYTATSGTAFESEAGFALQGTGDEIIAFQGTLAVPNFIFAIHFANGLTWTDAIDNNNSAVPSGLIDGVNAVAIPLGANNIIYDYNILSGQSQILAALTDPTEWSGGASQPLGAPGAAFSCLTTILEEGDIAITGVNSDGNDQFSFVLLTDVESGTEINFTDCGWLAAGGFRGYNAVSGSIQEGIIKWRAPSFLTCGTEIIIEEIAADVYSATLGTAEEIDGPFALGNADEVIVFQGRVAAPKFIFAFHYGNNNGWTDAINTANSAVPAGLTEGVNAVAFNADNSIYNYSVIANQTLILAATADPSNWSGNNSTPLTLGIPSGSFSCEISGACSDFLVWNGTVWTSLIGSGKTFPDISTNVTLFADYDTSVNPSFSACSLDIFNDVTLTVANDTFIIVQTDVNIDGNLVVETRGNFVQNDNGGNVIIGVTGAATLNKTTPVKQEWYYYTYWSSPVVGETIGNVFPSVPYDWKYSFNAANFVDNDGDDIDDNGNDWEFALDADTMLRGVGYAVAGERSSAASYPRADNISFTGAFNTGDIPVDITFDPSNSGVRWNFIGNPYPGAIDFVAFHLANDTVLEGAAYFWSQASPPDAGNPGNNAENLNLNDYAVFTVGTGGAAGGGPDIPNGYVASGQGFFIPALDIGTATFNNSMRVADGSSNNQFFKSSNSKKSSARATNPLENRLWLNLTTDNGVFNQILVGYVDKATDAYDGMAYDAPKFLNSGFAAALYSHIENDDTKYMIQGKALNTISEDEVITLGFISTISSDNQFKLSVEQFQGAFLTDNTIYLKDNLLGTTHNLTEADYTFTSDPGEFNSRFEIVFSVQSLSTDDNVLDNNALKIIQLDNDHVKFTVSDNLSIKSVRVFDLLGRELYNLKGSNSSETYNLSNLKDAIYIAKVELSNGAILTKKALKK